MSHSGMSSAIAKLYGEQLNNLSLNTKSSPLYLFKIKSKSDAEEDIKFVIGYFYKHGDEQLFIFVNSTLLPMYYNILEQKKLDEIFI